jgi:hypothetical protein
MAPIAHNAAAVKSMLYLTVPCAASLGLVHMLQPGALVSAFGKEAAKTPYLYSDAFMASVFLAFATTASIGLLSGDPGAFFPLIILQFLYKAYHTLAMAFARAPLTAHHVLYLVCWLGFMVGDVYVFASAQQRRAKKVENGDKKST